VRIISVWGREILDSRGNPTIEVDVLTQNGLGSAAAPSGASTGKYEAVELRDGGDRYLGKGVRQAVDNVNNLIATAITGMDSTDQQGIDLKMKSLDGTKDKSRLGANAMVATSMAVLRAAAVDSGKQLYAYLGGNKAEAKLPVAMFNVINGGKHAGGKLAIQEFMIMPSADSFAERLQMASEIYHVLGKQLVQKYGPSARNVGDEGGYAPQMKHTDEALDALVAAVEELGYEGSCDFAIDAAASSFYDAHKKTYAIDGQEMNDGEMIEFYKEVSKVYKIKSIEDPLHEEDFAGFAHLNAGLQGRVSIVGDDLVVTNVARIREAITHNSMTTLLLKVNQIGTISEALDAVELCREHGLKIIVSHRSGETEDCFISDFAVGIGAEYIKAGAPSRGERTAKYNQLLRIEERLFLESVAEGEGFSPGSEGAESRSEDVE
jgi:enolase